MISSTLNVGSTGARNLGGVLRLSSIITLKFYSPNDPEEVLATTKNYTILTSVNLIDNEVPCKVIRVASTPLRGEFELETIA